MTKVPTLDTTQSFQVYEYVSCEYLQGNKFNNWTCWTIQIQLDGAAGALCDFIIKETKQQNKFYFSFHVSYDSTLEEN